MNEEIWDYIDGNLNEDQQAATKAKIAGNPAYKAAYTELIEINQIMHSLEFEEPSMSFTRNVMEKVKLEIAPIALKTKVNLKIIYAIAAFFILPILFIFIYAVAHNNLSMSNFSLPTFETSLNIEQFVTPAFIKIFFFIDLIIALICLDGFLRSKKA